MDSIRRRIGLFAANPTFWKRSFVRSTGYHRSGLNVTIVPAIERGVNEHEVGKIIDFAIRHPAILGINFQPAFHAGRHAAHDPMQWMTIPNILQLIETQTTGKFKVTDFAPVLLLSNVQFRGIRVYRWRADHAAAENPERVRLPRLHHESRNARLES